MKHDHEWIDSYADMFEGKVVLELGCGSGIDTSVIAKYAEQLIAGDLVPNSSRGVMALDHSQALPFETDAFDTVVASLCLHYFSMDKTKDIIAEISRVLKTNGRFLCRVNSYKDESYGAVGFPEIEPGLYAVKGQMKRFFTERDIRMLWSRHYRLSEIAHKCIDRYNEAKYVYEFSAEKI